MRSTGEAGEQPPNVQKLFLDLVEYFCPATKILRSPTHVEMKFLYLWFLLWTFLPQFWSAFGGANARDSPPFQSQTSIDSCCVGSLHSDIGLRCQYPVGLSLWTVDALSKQSLLTREAQAANLISSMERTMSRLCVLHVAFIWRIACGEGDAASSSSKKKGPTSTIYRPSKHTDTLRRQILEISQTTTVLQGYRNELRDLRVAVHKDAARAKRVQEVGVRDKELKAQEAGNKHSLRQLRLLPDQISGPFDEVEGKVDEFVREAEQVKVVLECTLYLTGFVHQYPLYDTISTAESQSQATHTLSDPEAKIISRAWLVLRLLTDPCETPNYSFSDPASAIQDAHASVVRLLHCRSTALSPT